MFMMSTGWLGRGPAGAEMRAARTARGSRCRAYRAGSDETAITTIARARGRPRYVPFRVTTRTAATPATATRAPTILTTPRWDTAYHRPTTAAPAATRTTGSRQTSPSLMANPSSASAPIRQPIVASAANRRHMDGRATVTVTPLAAGVSLMSMELLYCPPARGPAVAR